MNNYINYIFAAAGIIASVFLYTKKEYKAGTWIFIFSLAIVMGYSITNNIDAIIKISPTFNQLQSKVDSLEAKLGKFESIKTSHADISGDIFIRGEISNPDSNGPPGFEISKKDGMDKDGAWRFAILNENLEIQRMENNVWKRMAIFSEKAK